jgi:hypothetical protein
VLIRCGHGLGDTIQFVRYLPLVRQMARRVILQTQASLATLCESVGVADEIVTLYSDVSRHRYDVAVDVMELPHVFRTTVRSIPAPIPYLRVRPRRIAAHNTVAVGLVWRAGDWDRRRSIPPPSLTKLSRVRGVTWHVLQSRYRWRSSGVDFGVDSGTDSVAEAARTLAGLDLMVTVDTMPAHLSGALGVPTWTLLCADCDWPWLSGRDDSPWYPTMRLFRQETPGDWQLVIENVTDELAKFVSERRDSMLAAA